MPKPWNKIEISEDLLKSLYENRGLSIAQIAQKFGYTNGPIHRLLREYDIKTRSISEAKEKFKITKRDLVNLYLHKRMSTQKIADLFGCNHVTVVNRMKKFGIKSRGHLGLTKPITITKDKLEYLYKTRGLSALKIAKIIHRSKSGIERKINNLKIEKRRIDNRACKHKKEDFSGTLEEKAYMIGFRLGDLNVYKKKNVIVIRCSTTKKAQVLLIKKLFSPYGGITITKAKRGTLETVAYVNLSFEFLIPKKDEIPDWITKNNNLFLSFFAGYADAEGSLFFRRRRGKKMRLTPTIEINSYDKNILKEIWRMFKGIGIVSPPICIGSPKGTPCGNKNYFANNDSWKLTISRKRSIWILINYWDVFSRHLDKKRAIKKIKENLIIRNHLPYSRKIELTVPKVY